MRQTAYVQEILKKAAIGDISGVETPILASWKWPEVEDATVKLNEEYYDRFLSIVGSLNWLVVKTRPDIRYTVTKL
jgi:hypothetical protein